MNIDQHQLQSYHDAMEKFLMTLNASQEYIKLTNLELNTEYNIIDDKIINTKHGNKAELILNEKYKLLLPDRFTKMFTNEKIQSLVKAKIKLVYKGIKQIYNNQTKHDIEFVKSSEEK